MNPLKNNQNSINEMDYSTEQKVPFGPNEKWREEWFASWAWCKKHNMEETFRLLIDTFNLQGSDILKIPFRNIINILSNDHSLNLLEAWALNDVNSQKLYLLAKAAQTDIQNDIDEIVDIAAADEKSGKNLAQDQYYLLRIYLDRKSVV